LLGLSGLQLKLLQKLVTLRLLLAIDYLTNDYCLQGNRISLRLHPTLQRREDAMNLEHAGQLAPIATALIALVAASVAIRSLYLQRDIARRRAAIDFFLKTDADKEMIKLYRTFRVNTPNLATLITQPDFTKSDVYSEVRHYLNICELIAVGINHGAFSERVAKAYWGGWLPTVYKGALPLIEYVRRTPGEGRAKTYVELEVLCSRWAS
jgi:hypothetical protein